MKKYCLFLKYVSHFLQLQEEKCEMIHTASMHQCNVLSLQYCFNYTRKTKDINFQDIVKTLSERIVYIKVVAVEVNRDSKNPSAPKLIFDTIKSCDISPANQSRLQSFTILPVLLFQAPAGQFWRIEKKENFIMFLGWGRQIWSET